MRDYRDAKAMARSLRDNLKSKSIDLSHSETLELIAKALGFKDWNVLAARIEGSSGVVQLAEPTEAEPAPRDRCCSFCGKAQDEVKKLIAGPAAFICDACVGRCEGALRGDAPSAESGRLPASRADGMKQLQRLREIQGLFVAASSAGAAPVSATPALDSIRALPAEQRQAQAAEISKRINEIQAALERLP